MLLSVHFKKINKVGVRLVICLAWLVFFALPSFASAATLSLSPASGVYTIGSTIMVRVLVNTTGTSINAAEGTLTFNPSELSVVNVSSAGSIFSLWTTEPTFSNTQGTVSFGGGNPKGYVGASGTIMTVSFRALRESSSRVSFSSGTVLANDGMGTNVLTSMSSGVFTLNPQTIDPPVEYVAPVNTPSAPEITSSTHPNSATWYSANKAVLKWKVPTGITSVRVLLGNNPSTVPTVVHTPAISERTLEDLQDGVWYFHAQFKNENGWGRVAHFRIRVDSTNPSYFKVEKVESEDPTDPSIVFKFDAKDATSGIHYYDVQIDDDEPDKWDPREDNLYSIDILTPGRHNMIVKAVDGSGHYLVDSISFIVDSLESPIISEYTSELGSGTILVVRGTTLPSSTVVMSVVKDTAEPDIFEIKSDATGVFTFVYPEKTGDGIYKIWAEVIDKRGARSEPSEFITIAVRPSDLSLVGRAMVSAFSLIVPIAGSLVLLVLIVIYGHHRIVILRRRLRKEVSEAESALHRAFSGLKEDVSQAVEMFEVARKRRKLTDEETQVIEKLQSDLLSAEAAVQKEIGDIEKEL